MKEINAVKKQVTLIQKGVNKLTVETKILTESVYDYLIVPKGKVKGYRVRVVKLCKLIVWFENEEGLRNLKLRKVFVKRNN